MLYADSAAFRAAPRKAVTIFGMSGVGKTRLASLLRDSGWFHYSVDYRIGARYMGEFIEDDLRREAMRSGRLRPLLMTDSIRIGANITFHDLSALSAYLGKPGDPARGGIPFEEYVRRQRQHRAAEIAALMDCAEFIERAHLDGYEHFVADTGGSLCEVVDPFAPKDAVLAALSRFTTLLYIRGDERHEEELARRFERAPKPMYYEEGFLKTKWAEYKAAGGAARDDDVDPDGFIRWGFRQLLRRRIPRYQAIADGWGYYVEAEEVAALRDEKDFCEMMGRAIARRGAAAQA